jgi:hypothetical protein
MNHALIEIPQHGGYLCEACGVRIACLELVAICGPDWLRNLSIIPGCPGPREEKPWSSPAAMVELIHQLLDDRDPLTGEPREPIITREEAMKLLDLAAADEGIRFPKGGVKPGAPVLDEATAFDDVIAAWKVPPSTLSLGPLEVRTSTVIPPGEFRLFPLEPKPFDDRIFAEAIESIRKDLCERQEKLRRVFFAGADFAKPDEEQPLIVTFPQAKRLDKLAASAIRFDKTCAGCGIRLPGGFKSDVCKPCAESKRDQDRTLAEAACVTFRARPRFAKGAATVTTYAAIRTTVRQLDQSPRAAAPAVVFLLVPNISRTARNDRLQRRKRAALLSRNNCTAIGVRHRAARTRRRRRPTPTRASASCRARVTAKLRSTGGSHDQEAINRAL